MGGLKIMRTILFTNARDEDNIEEWIIHHRLLGFDTIYVIDHLSVDPLMSKLGSLGLDYLITERSNVPNHNGLKGAFVTKAVTYAKLHNYDWMLYLDADEFLVLPRDATVADFLQRFPGVDQIGVNWWMFGSNYHDAHPKGLLMHNFTRCEQKIHGCIKSFVRPQMVLHAGTAHFYTIPPTAVARTMQGLPLDKGSPWNRIDIPLEECIAYVAHYYNQSYAKYIQRKIALPRDDINEFRDEITKQDLHYRANNTINTYLADHYAPQVQNELRRLCPDHLHYFDTTPPTTPTTIPSS